MTEGKYIVSVLNIAVQVAVPLVCAIAIKQHLAGRV